MLEGTRSQKEVLELCYGSFTVFRCAYFYLFGRLARLNNGDWNLPMSREMYQEVERVKRIFDKVEGQKGIISIPLDIQKYEIVIRSDASGLALA